ncbi:histidine kinase [Aquimarina sp. U1-2]|uniref:sensor histidine kinase n=1 Tax=Aquimarina sp. U1-2 TaxID=2823141 RepID=UPI001AED1078|nr:histidine kinase [Aquimarina sp. U1-2]MBP2833011.1 histidine kinase [Aquimarina sp. U1-2]
MTLARIMFTYEYVTTDVFPESERSKNSIFDINYITAAFIGEIYVIGFTTAIKITIDYAKNLRKTKELEKQSLKTELSLLKTQLQPHFFFNTLNNVYSLTLEKSDQAPETVVKLSEFMSYIIYQGNKKRVSLLDEVKYIQNYIDLERLRFGDRVEVKFSISGRIEGFKIPPLLLLQFVENSFKHGTSYELGKVKLYLNLEVKGDWLIFTTHNKKRIETEDCKKKGIGLKNTTRRLKLLYESNYDLHIDENETDYTITLKIPL